jgi:peptidyl-prolyl cis-trans isomerase C
MTLRLFVVLQLLLGVLGLNVGTIGSSLGLKSSMVLKMGLFDFLKPAGRKPEAAARHILVKGKDAPDFLENLKSELNASKNVEKAFADAAMKHSTCPSAKSGGALGQFKRGAMVPAFDKVVFTEEVGQIHGPVKTPFGAHLIFIQDRFDMEE